MEWMLKIRLRCGDIQKNFVKWWSRTKEDANQTVQRTGASRVAQRPIEPHQRLAAVADRIVRSGFRLARPGGVIDILAHIHETMPDETGGLSDQSGGDAESALESAARHLRASPRPAGAVAAREREILRGRQTRDLVAWAREQGCLIQPAEYSALLEPGGEEHRVWVDERRQFYFKATHPGRFGFSVIADAAYEPLLVAATPLEYLERLLLQNSVFGDEVRLTGAAEETGGIVILTSQPNVTGDAVSAVEITEFMSRLWFRPLRGLSLGNPGALAFYRDLDEIAAFDAHPANFVKDQQSNVLPIDLILVRAEPALQSALARFLS